MGGGSQVGGAGGERDILEMNHGVFPWGEFHFVTAHSLASATAFAPRACAPINFPNVSWRVKTGQAAIFCNLRTYPSQVVSESWEKCVARSFQGDDEANGVQTARSYTGLCLRCSTTLAQCNMANCFEVCKIKLSGTKLDNVALDAPAACDTCSKRHCATAEELCHGLADMCLVNPGDTQAYFGAGGRVKGWGWGGGPQVWRDEAVTRGLGCIQGANANLPFDDCFLNKKLPFSAACSECYTRFAECAVTKCRNDCAMSQGGALGPGQFLDPEHCAQCMETGCEPAWKQCSGYP